MLNNKILQKAIDKAENNGFDNKNISCFDTGHIPPHLYVRFLFCEDFAKAFWGEDIIEIESFYPDPFNEPPKSWQYHLQEMVLCEEPLKYLETFL